jgi:orotate phosphoribosyltransferase
MGVLVTESEIVEILTKTGAVLDGHFLLSSGLHSDRYFQMALVLQYPEYAKRLAEELTARFAGERIDAVIGPAIGGIILSYQLAQLLNARSIFAERQDGIMSLRRGFSINQGERILVCEDVITTGGSVREVSDIARNAGADICGICCLVLRGNAEFDCRFEFLIQMVAVNYKPQECPLCARNIPIIKPGSRGLK